MRTKIKTKSFFCFYLALLMLGQSCRVYDAGSLTVDQAVASESFVKIRRHEGKPLKYKRLIEEDGKIYGITKKRGKEIKHEISVNTIKKIKRKNKTWSTIATITGGSALALLTIVTIALASFDLNFDGLGGWTW